MGVILLPILLSLLLSLEGVQNFAKRQATEWLSEKTQSEISIERLRLRLFNRVTVEGVCWLDQQQDTLFYLDELIAPVQGISLRSGAISLGHVRLREPSMHLIHDSTGISNFKQILNLFPKREKRNKESNFKLTASALTIEGMAFEQDKWEKQQRPYGVNFTDIDVSDIHIAASEIAVIGDSVSLRVDSLSLREQSGLHIEQVSCDHITISEAGVLLYGAALRTADSRLNAPFISLSSQGAGWPAFKEFLTDVSLYATLKESTVGFGSIGYFAPELRSWSMIATDVSGTIHGPVSSLQGELTQLRMDQTQLSVRFTMEGLPEIEQTRFQVELPRLVTTPENLSYMLHDITGTEVTASNQTLLKRAGNLHFEGLFNGLISDFRAEGSLRSQLGGLNMALSIQPQRDSTTNLIGTAFAGDISTQDFELGALLDSEKLGGVTLSAEVSGRSDREDLRFAAQAQIPTLSWNDYDYEGIALLGSFDNRQFTGKINSPDPHLAFLFNGELDFNDSIPDYDFGLRLHYADLARLGLNQRDSISQVSGDFTAHFSGNTLDNVNGEALVSDLQYINHIDTVRTGEIRFVAENNQSRKRLGMQASFADAELQGRLSYANILSYFQNTLVDYLPSLSEREPAPEQSEEVATSSEFNPENYYILKLDVKEANNVAGILLPGLQLAEGTRLLAMFNPLSEQFNLSLTSDFIERGNFFVSGLNLSSRNQADSITLLLRSEDIFVQGIYMPNFSILGGAKQNRINLGMRFQNSEDNSNALISVSSELKPAREGSLPELDVRFNPSTLTYQGNTWQVRAESIKADSLRVAIENFSIARGDRRLLVDGIASRSIADTLAVRLENFNLSPLTALVSELGYSVSGLSQGEVEIASALRGGSMRAQVSFDSVRINDTPLPPFTFSNTWDFLLQRAQFQVNNKQTQQEYVSGYFSPSNSRFLLNAELPGIDMALLDPILDGVIGETKGRAHASLTLSNPDKRLKIDGTILADTLSTKVLFTQVPYQLIAPRFDVINSVMTLQKNHLTDPLGNRAAIDLRVDFSNQKNISYQAQILPERVQVLNLTQHDNDLFYGTVFASGSAKITGDRNQVAMDIRMQSDPNTHFYLPLGGASTITQADFVRFVSSDTSHLSALSEAQRRLQALRERNKAEKSAAAESTVNLNIHMDLNVQPSAQMELILDPTTGDVLQGRGSGTLSLDINPREELFNIYGDYNIAQGSYRFSLGSLVTKNFVIRPGSRIQWSGDPLEAQLDITAAYEVKASLAPLMGSSTGSFNSSTQVECLIYLQDEMMHPTISFGVEVPNASPEVATAVAAQLNSQEAIATQFVYLLAARTFSAENSSDQNIGAVGVTAGFDFLTSKLSEIMSSERFSFVPQITAGNDLSSNEFGGAIYGEIIKDRLIIEADVAYDSRNNAATSINSNAGMTGDATLSYLLSPDGNLRVKAFTRTIDSFDENQGLQESGIGIFFREDFNHFGELGPSLRRRFGNLFRSPEKREEREAERRAEERDDEGDNESDNEGDDDTSSPSAPMATPLAPASTTSPTPSSEE